jgi:hypothetical protein
MVHLIWIGFGLFVANGPLYLLITSRLQRNGYAPTVVKPGQIFKLYTMYIEVSRTHSWPKWPVYVSSVLWIISLSFMIIGALTQS